MHLSGYHESLGSQFALKRRHSLGGNDELVKGAMLMTTWFDTKFRPTRDLDFLGFGESEPDKVLDIFREICAVAQDDGVSFAADAIKVERNREELEYGGLRLKTQALVDGARVPVVIDIGFGDAIEPGLDEIDYPVLLDPPAPKLRGYRPETVVAEKFEAIVKLVRLSFTKVIQPDRGFGPCLPIKLSRDFH
jgi:hypothetical protein